MLICFFCGTRCSNWGWYTGFQRIIYQDARQDAWISVLLAGIATHLVTFCMIKTLEIYSSDDLYGIQIDILANGLAIFKCNLCHLLLRGVLFCFTKLY